MMPMLFPMKIKYLFVTYTMFRFSFEAGDTGKSQPISSLLRGHAQYEHLWCQLASSGRSLARQTPRTWGGRVERTVWSLYWPNIGVFGIQNIGPTYFGSTTNTEQTFTVTSRGTCDRDGHGEHSANFSGGRLGSSCFDNGGKHFCQRRK